MIMKKYLFVLCGALALVGCRTNDYEGAPDDDVDVIYGPAAGETRSPGGIDLPRGTNYYYYRGDNEYYYYRGDNEWRDSYWREGLEPLRPPIATMPSGNRLRSPEPPPANPTQTLPRP